MAQGPHPAADGAAGAALTGSMVDFLKRLFEKDATADSPADRDHALRLATATWCARWRACCTCPTPTSSTPRSARVSPSSRSPGSHNRAMRYEELPGHELVAQGLEDLARDLTLVSFERAAECAS